MNVLTCSLDPNDEVFRAIQTILNAITSDRQKLIETINQRDSLLNALKSFETERLSENLLNTEMDENYRKKIKMEHSTIDKLPESANDSVNDDLNAAFSSSMYECEVVEPTQIRLKSDELLLVKSEHNKENDLDVCNEEYEIMVANNKSPTVLNKFVIKKNPKENNKKEQMSIQGIEPNEDPAVYQTNSINESYKWREKAPTHNTRPHQLFDSKSMKISSQNNTRKRLSLALRLKQTTINFPRCEEETFCEGYSSFDKSQLGIKDEKCIKTLSPKLKVEPEDELSLADNSIIAVTMKSDEILAVDQSEPTQKVYEDAIENKKDVSAAGPQDVVEESGEKMSFANLDCKECKKYHRLMGRNLEKNPPKKYGVCSKHHRNGPYQLNETPPGFWNARIIDSDSDEEDTPYNSHFRKK